LEPYEILEVLSQEDCSLDAFKRRAKRWLRGYTEKDQKRIMELEGKLHALKLTASQLPRVTLRCFVCGCEVCDPLFVTVERPSFRGDPVVVDWSHECGGDLICYPPTSHYNRTGKNSDPQVTLDLGCRVVSTVNCDPEKYKIGKHPSGKQELLPDPVDIDPDLARDLDRRINNGPSGDKKDQIPISAVNLIRQKAVLKERELFTRLASVKAFPVVLEAEPQDPSDDIKPSVKALLKQLYPNDQATGYAVGQVRGAVSIKTMID
jgi:hypothetical protein